MTLILWQRLEVTTSVLSPASGFFRLWEKSFFLHVVVSMSLALSRSRFLGH